MNTFNRIGKHKHSVKNQSGSYGLRIVSVGTLNWKRERAVLAWAVRAILEFHPTIGFKRRSALSVTFTLRKPKTDVQYGLADGSITICRADFLKLKSFPKPPRDQLVITLSTDMGFRSGEVASLRIENIDIENGKVLVFDSKKYKFYPIPLPYQVARTYEELLAQEGRREGWVIQQHERCAWRRGKPITTIGLCDIWKRWAKRAQIPNWKQFTPTLGRHCFAAWFFYVKKGNLEILRRILRHKNLLTTQIYLSKLMFYEDVQAEMQRLQTIPTIETNQEECGKSEICKYFEAAEKGCCKNQTICKHCQVCAGVH